jgi:hypothetical protein
MTRDAFITFSKILACGSAVLWASAIAFDVTYFGDAFSFAFRRGCIALYWGVEDRELRNSLVLNLFTWPDLPASGVGTDWSLDRWGRWDCYGPGVTLLRDARTIALRPLTGLYAPGFSLGPPIGYIGIPLWTVTALGATGWLTLSCHRRRPSTACPACGYDLVGTPTATCPECGL